MRLFLAPLVAIALVFASVTSGVGSELRAGPTSGRVQARSDGEKAILATDGGPSRSQLTNDRSGKRGLFHLPLLLVLSSRPRLSVPAPQSTTQAIPLCVLHKDVGPFHHAARAPPCPFAVS